MKKWYKECPYCANEIKEWAVKCSYCEEFLDGRHKSETTNKKVYNSFFNKNKYVWIIVWIILILLVILCVSKIKEHDSWQWFYFVDWAEWELMGPNFSYYFECEDRVTNRFSKWLEAFCGLNCKSSKWSSDCKEVIKPHNPFKKEIMEEAESNIINQKPYIEKWTQINGDFDWDWVKENARTYADVNHEFQEWTCYIQFEKNKFPKIIIENCIWWDLVNEWDLNQDWSDEIWIQPSRFTSCRWWYQVRTYKNWKWGELVDAISNHCDQREECYAKTNDDCDRISVYSPWKVKIYSSEFTDDWIIWKYSIIDL